MTAEKFFLTKEQELASNFKSLQAYKVAVAELGDAREFIWACRQQQIVRRQYRALCAEAQNILGF